MTTHIENDPHAPLDLTPKASEALKARLAAWAIRTAREEAQSDLAAAEVDSAALPVQAPAELKARLAAWATRTAREEAQTDLAAAEVDSAALPVRTPAKTTARPATGAAWKPERIMLFAAIAVAASVLMFLRNRSSPAPVSATEAAAHVLDASRSDVLCSAMEPKPAGAEKSIELLAQLQRLQIRMEGLEEELKRVSAETRAKGAQRTTVAVPDSVARQRGAPGVVRPSLKDSTSPAAILPPAATVDLDDGVDPLMNLEVAHVERIPKTEEKFQPEPQPNTPQNAGLKWEIMANIAVAPVSTVIQVSRTPLSVATRQEDQ